MSEYVQAIDYKGLTIQYSEMHNTWNVQDGRETIASDLASLTLAKASADRHLKKADGFKKFEVYYKGRWGSESAYLATVTSITEHDEYWISYAVRGDGKAQRSKVKKSELYKTTDANKTRILYAQSKNEESDRARKEAATTLTELEPID
jgi:hypothetical protein